MSAKPIRVTEIDFPSEAELLEVAQTAAAAHLNLITDGFVTKLSPDVPPGWFRIGVSVKEAE